MTYWDEEGKTVQIGSIMEGKDGQWTVVDIDGERHTIALCNFNEEMECVDEKPIGVAPIYVNDQIDHHIFCDENKKEYSVILTSVEDQE